MKEFEKTESSKSGDTNSKSTPVGLEFFVAQTTSGDPDEKMRRLVQTGSQSIQFELLRSHDGKVVVTTSKNMC